MLKKALALILFILSTCLFVSQKLPHIGEVAVIRRNFGYVAKYGEENKQPEWIRKERK